MANPYFQFKQFTVRHDKCGMKVGTDAVLLGAWADVTNRKTILDIGTGSGIIALMLAQRSEAMIEAIDIDGDACAQAKENAEASPFAERIRVVHASCSEFVALVGEKRFDLIVSNPPYFIQSLRSPDNKRSLARHTDTLSLSELFDGASALLSDRGRVALVLPYEQLEEVKAIASQHGLSVYRLTAVHPTPESSPKRLLIEFSKEEIENYKQESLTIELARHQYTEEYIALTKAFYLKM